MIEFKETYHIWLDSNPLPEIDSDDQAFCNRLHPIPATVTIPDESNRPETCPRNCWPKARVSWPNSGGRGALFQIRATAPGRSCGGACGWREEFDVIGRFIEERCTLTAPGVSRRRHSTASAFTEWRRAEGEKVVCPDRVRWPVAQTRD